MFDKLSKASRTSSAQKMRILVSALWFAGRASEFVDDLTRTPDERDSFFVYVNFYTHFLHVQKCERFSTLISIDGVPSIALLGDNVQFIPDIHTHNYNSSIVLFNTLSITFKCIVMCAWWYNICMYTCKRPSLFEIKFSWLIKVTFCFKHNICMSLLLCAIYLLRGAFKSKYILIIRSYIHHAPRSHIAQITQR